MRRGVKPGDAIAFQLPNWLEAAATFYAIAYLGAVVVPIVHFYGPKEVAYILKRTRVKALVTADRFGAQDFLANLDSMRGDLPDLEWVAVVGGEPRPGDLRFDDLRRATESLDVLAAVDPSEPALVAYTSGTTSDPKGVVHAHRTIGARSASSAASSRSPGSIKTGSRRRCRSRRRRSRARPSATASGCSRRCSCRCTAAVRFT